jgi:hypothetical protein
MEILILIVNRCRQYNVMGVVSLAIIKGGALTGDRDSGSLPLDLICLNTGLVMLPSRLAPLSEQSPPVKL